MHYTTTFPTLSTAIQAFQTAWCHHLQQCGGHGSQTVQKATINYTLMYIVLLCYILYIIQELEYLKDYDFRFHHHYYYPNHRPDICHEYHESYLLKKIVKWINFSLPCMTIVGKSKISPHVKKFQMSPSEI